MSTTPPTRAGTFRFAGRDLTLPVTLDDAAGWFAAFVVPAPAASALVGPLPGLELVHVAPGRAVCVVAFADYRASSLGSYREAGVLFPVRDAAAPGAGPWSSLGRWSPLRTWSYVHQMPVTEAFTCEAGRALWGYPKFLAEVDITTEDGTVTGTLHHDGAHVCTLRLRPGPRVPLPAAATTATLVARRDGAVYRTPNRVRARHLTLRPGGAELTLGDHPIASELRGLGLPRGALATITVDGIAGACDAAEVTPPAGP